MTPRTVTLSVEVDNEADFVDLFERLSRVAAGEILAGRQARVYSFDDDPQDPPT